jgi:predicted dehydrogenase
MNGVAAMPFQVAFFGAQESALPYLHALARREDVRVVAVCDPDLRAAEQAAAGWGARIFPHYDAMLRDMQPDALWVCVPSRLQAGILEQAVEQGLPFLVDAPGACDMTLARRIGRRIDEKELVAAVGYTARAVDVIREAREYLGANPVPLAMAWWLAPGKEKTPSASQLLWEEGCQLMDLLRFFCGDLELAGAFSTVQEALAATFRTAQATVASLSLAAYEMVEPRVELELLGEGWYFRFLEGLTTLRLAERDKITIIRQANQPQAELAAAFLDGVAAGKLAAPCCSYLEALPTLELCQAVAEKLEDEQDTANS